MKTKLFGKMTLLAFVLMVTISMGLLSPMLLTMSSGLSVITVPSQVGHTIEVTNYQSSFDYDDLDEFTVAATTYTGFVIPTASVKEGGTANLKVTNSAGKTVEPLTADSGTNSGKTFVAVSGSDTYTFTYSVVNGDITTATRDIVVKVTANEATLEFDSNSAQIIPTIAQSGDKITFPQPKVMIGDDEKTDATVSMKLESATGDVTSQLVTENGFKTYTVKSTDSGTFTVTYTFNNNGTDVVEKFTFNVATKRPEVTLSYNGYSSSTSSLSMTVGNEVTLPTPTVINKAANNATVENVYTVVTVQNTTNSNDTYEPITNFKFTPKEDGNFKFTYKTVDFAGNGYSEFFFVNYVTKSGNSIQIKVVDDYDVANVATMDIDELDNADYKIPSKRYKKTSDTKLTVNFPAVFAVGGWGDYDNLKFTRSIYRNNSRIATLENETKPESTETYGANETVPYEFDFTNTTDTDGTYTYTVRYEVCYVDNSGNVISGTTKQLSSYTLEIVNDDTFTNTALTVKVPANMPSTVRSGKTISFGAPTVTDYKNADSSEIVDTRINTVVSYYFDDNSSNSTVVKAKDGKYSIDVDKPAEYAGAFSKITVVFTATDDYQTVTESKVINIVDYASDTTAPALSGTVSFAGLDSTTEIKLPNVTFTDEATDIRLIAYIINEKGKVVDFVNASTSGARTATIKDAVYKPSVAGKYVVTFVATDQNNNSSTFSINYEVSFYNGYSVTIDNISAQEYGTVINLLDYINVYANGEQVDNASLNISFTNEEVTQATLDALNDKEMLIQITGKYMEPTSDRMLGEIVTLDDDISVRAWVMQEVSGDKICDISANGSAKVTFASADSNGPSFTLTDEALNNSNYAWDSTITNSYELPWFKSINDMGSGVDETSMKLTLKYQGDSDNLKVFDVSEGFDPYATDALKFTATKQGKINAVYSVADLSGNVTERTFVLNIGDVIAPEIVLGDDAITAPEKASKNGTLVIDLSKITVKEDESSLDADDLTIVITRNGEEVEFEIKNNTITIDASTAGSYVVTMDVKDAAGNEATQIVKTFTVASASSNTTSSSTVWGTILIVISLIVLGLVIFFFVKPSKSSKSTTTLKTKKDDDKKTK